MGIPLNCFAFCGTARILEFDARPRKRHQQSCQKCSQDLLTVYLFARSSRISPYVPQKVWRTHSSGRAGVAYRSRVGLSS
jgi:hypothetical protein